MTPPVLYSGDAAGRPGTGRTQIIHSGAARTATPTVQNSRHIGGSRTFFVSHPVTTARPGDWHSLGRSEARRMRAVVRDSGRPGDDAPALVISPNLTPGWRSGLHTSPGRGCFPVVEAGDVGDPIAPHGQDLPALCRSPRLASGRRAGDVQPHQECPGAGGHLRDHRACTGGSKPDVPFMIGA